ncbi:MAG: peroxiredoxin [Melioribacteraceae bacterium]|nr:peroxiredoxin [Melioribacteraceae bacterium]
MGLNVGDKAPDFTLKNTNQEPVTLSSFQGDKNVVLLFFPGVGTGVCEKELCSTRDSLKDYENLDAQVLAVSVDSMFAQKLWVNSLNLNYPLLSDFNKEVAPEYDALYDVWLPGKFDMKGVAKRAAFVIDKEGVIRYAEVLENAGEEPDYDAIKQSLESI